MDATTIGALVAAAIAAVVAFLQAKGKKEAAARAEQFGTVATVAVRAIEKSDDKSVKGIVTSLAKDQGVHDLVDGFVQKVVRGIAPALLVLLLPALLLLGCASPEAGRSAAPAWGQGIQVPVVQVFVGEGAHLPAGVDSQGHPLSPISILVTNAGSGTTSPSSTATQSAAASPQVQGTIPVQVGPGGVGAPIRLPGTTDAKKPESPAPAPTPASTTGSGG